MGPPEDPAFRALVAQAKQVCAKHPDLLQAYLATIRDRGKGLKTEELQAILDAVTAVVPAAMKPEG